MQTFVIHKSAAQNTRKSGDDIYLMGYSVSLYATDATVHRVTHVFDYFRWCVIKPKRWVVAVNTVQLLPALAHHLYPIIGW